MDEDRENAIFNPAHVYDLGSVLLIFLVTTVTKTCVTFLFVSFVLLGFGRYGLTNE